MNNARFHRLVAALNSLSVSVERNQTQPRPEGVNDSNRADFCDCIYNAILSSEGYGAKIKDCVKRFGPMLPDSFERNCPLVTYFDNLAFCRRLCQNKKPVERMKCVMECLDRFK